MVCRQPGPRGFTIVELLIVIVVIGILAAITIVAYSGIQQRAVVATLNSDLEGANKLLKIDQVTSSSYPATLALANSGKGIPASSGTSYTYAVSNATSPQTFCLTATNNTQSYNVTQEGGPAAGTCPYLNLDASSSTSYPRSGTVWTDLSGNGIIGTLLNGAAYSNVNGGVMNFDGVSARVETNIQTYGNNTTWESCFNGSQDISGNNMFMGRFLPYFGFSAANSLIFSNNIGGSQRTVISPANLAVNTWYCPTFTTSYDGTNTKMSTYVNGSLVASNAWAGAQANYASVFAIGDGQAAAWYPFKGMVSNVKIYNRTLSSTEIQQDFSLVRGRFGI